jgi:hypothetical protein
MGPSSTGIKAYYATVTMKTDATTDPGGLKELFAVGCNLWKIKNKQHDRIFRNIFLWTRQCSNG